MSERIPKKSSSGKTAEQIDRRSHAHARALSGSESNMMLLQRQVGNQTVSRLLQEDRNKEGSDEKGEATLTDEMVAAMGLTEKMKLAFKHSIPHWPGGVGQAAKEFFTDPLTIGVLIASIAVFVALAFVPDPTLITKVAVVAMIIALISAFGYATIKGSFDAIKNFYNRCSKAKTVKELEEAGRLLAVEGGEPLFNILLFIVSWRGGKAIRSRVEKSRAARAGEGEPTSPSEPVSEPIKQRAGKELDVDRLARQGKIDVRMLKQMVIESWKQGGGNRPVKIVSVQRGASPRVRGYITQEKFVRGRTPEQMEKLLGLPEGELTTKGQGAIIEVLEQIPSEGQFELRGYTQRPGGKAFEPGEPYPPGLGIPQWQLIEDVPAKVLKTVKPGESF